MANIKTSKWNYTIFKKKSYSYMCNEANCLDAMYVEPYAVNPGGSFMRLLFLDSISEILIVTYSQRGYRIRTKSKLKTIGIFFCRIPC